MFDSKIIEPIGFIVAVLTLVFSFFLFYSENGVLFGSLGAAAMAAGLTWVSYVILRIFLLALRR